MVAGNTMIGAIPVCYLLEYMHFMSLCCSKCRIVLAVFKGSVREAVRNDFIPLTTCIKLVTNTSFIACRSSAGGTEGVAS
jgi:hypothetical protein